MKWLAIMLLAVSPAMSAARAQTGSEALAHGRAVAEAWCANCHVVSGSARSGADAAPSFASIARRAPDPAELRGWLANRHKSTMPNYDLSRSEVEDVIAYLLSLRR